jgi:hypothetical protein
LCCANIQSRIENLKEFHQHSAIFPLISSSKIAVSQESAVVIGFEPGSAGQNRNALFPASSVFSAWRRRKSRQDKACNRGASILRTEIKALTDSKPLTVSVTGGNLSWWKPMESQDRCLNPTLNSATSSFTQPRGYFVPQIRNEQLKPRQIRMFRDAYVESQRRGLRFHRLKVFLVVIFAGTGIV